MLGEFIYVLLRQCAIVYYLFGRLTSRSGWSVGCISLGWLGAIVIKFNKHAQRFLDKLAHKYIFGKGIIIVIIAKIIKIKHIT